jgi:hypothetical protein
MKKLTWTWKKIVVLIAAAFGIGTLVSCYGVPPGALEDSESPYYGQEYENENSDDAEAPDNADSQTSETATE